MQFLDGKLSMATLVVAVIMMVIVVPQFNKAELKKEEKVFDMPDIPPEANFKLNFCGEAIDSIHKHINTSQPINATRVFEVGYQKWLPVTPLLSPLGHMMATAWKKARQVVENVGDDNKELPTCDDESGRDVALLMTCFNMGILHTTLGADVRAYANKCTNNVAYWEDLYRKIGKPKEFPHEHDQKLKTFINKEFIEMYRHEYPAEKLSLVSDCCQSKHAWKPTFAMFKKVALGGSKDEYAKVKADPDKIGKHYKEWVLDTCLQTFPYYAVYMVALEQVSQIIPGGSDEFIQKLKPDIRDDIFRYQFCKSLVSSGYNIHEQKRALAWNVLFEDLDYGRVQCYQ